MEMDISKALKKLFLWFGGRGGGTYIPSKKKTVLSVSGITLGGKIVTKQD